MPYYKKCHKGTAYRFNKSKGKYEKKKVWVCSGRIPNNWKK